MLHYITKITYFNETVCFTGCLEVDGHEHNLSILDNAGQHDYETMRLCSYKDIEVLVLCYSVVDRNSLESIKEFWVPEVNSSRRRRKPIILVGTQTDLRKDPTTLSSLDHVSKDEGEMTAKEIGARAFIECTAYNTESVNHVFETMTTAGVKYRKRRNSLVRKMFGR